MCPTTFFSKATTLPPSSLVAYVDTTRFDLVFSRLDQMLETQKVEDKETSKLREHVYDF